MLCLKICKEFGSHDLEEEPKKITKNKTKLKGEKVGDMKGTQPAKYYSKDADGDEMSVATKKVQDILQKVIQENQLPT